MPLWTSHLGIWPARRAVRLWDRPSRFRYLFLWLSRDSFDRALYSTTMGILLLVIGAIGVTSGGFKLRERPRAQVGLSPLTIAEAVLGGITLLGSGLGLARARSLAWTMVFLVLGAVVWSSAVHTRRLLAHYWKRDESALERFRANLGQ